MSLLKATNHAAQYGLVRSFAAASQCMDTDAMLSLAGQLGILVHESSRRRKARAEAHIAMCFPSLTAEEIAEIARQSMKNLAQLVMVDALVLPRVMRPGTWPTYAELGDVSLALDLLVRGQPIILVTGHCGNWEMLSHLLAALGYPIHALARPLDNPYINAWFVGLREATGTRIITKFGATPEIQKVLRNGGRLGFIADQDAGPGGVFVPFFDRLASSYRSVGVLAMRYNVPVVVGMARRLNGGLRYHVAALDIIRPDDWAAANDPLYFITARFSHAMEHAVRMAPDQYMWAYRRWRSRPKFERDGEPMPDDVRARIESLPWITPEALGRIVKNSMPESASASA